MRLRAADRCIAAVILGGSRDPRVTPMAIYRSAEQSHLLA